MGELLVSFLSPLGVKPTTSARLTEGSARRGAPRRWTLVATPSSATGATAPLTTKLLPEQVSNHQRGPAWTKMHISLHGWRSHLQHLHRGRGVRHTMVLH